MGRMRWLWGSPLIKTQYQKKKKKKKKKKSTRPWAQSLVPQKQTNIMGGTVEAIFVL
jgi:hypothetical protein